MFERKVRSRGWPMTKVCLAGRTRVPPLLAWWRADRNWEEMSSVEFADGRRWTCLRVVGWGWE